MVFILKTIQNEVFEKKRINEKEREGEKAMKKRLTTRMREGEDMV